MNYLAHIYLSGPDPHVQVGGLLGDFVKGPLADRYPEQIETGIRLHRRIDATTDRHPLFLQRLAELPRPWRRYGGILLDIYFDHLLAARWDEFHPRSLDPFCRSFYAILQDHEPLLPDRARHFCRRAPEVRWLQSYADPGTVPLMLDNLGQRLRRPVSLGAAWPELRRRHPVLEETFYRLMEEHGTMAADYLRDSP